MSFYGSFKPHGKPLKELFETEEERNPRRVQKTCTYVKRNFNTALGLSFLWGHSTENAWERATKYFSFYVIWIDFIIIIRRGSLTKKIYWAI